MITKIWNRLFLEERSSLSLSLFRMVVAFTVGSHVIPSFVHLADNYYLTAYKTVNTNFFPVDFILLVQKSPVWLIDSFVAVFLIFWAFFFIGLWSQVSCILMVASCYFFYALNAFHVGTLSWDILLVTLFLMCVTNYHGDYFSVDSVLRKNKNPYKRKRPFFLQRLLQLQIGFTFFYTGIVKIYPEGNWIYDNPMYYIMNYPPSGTTKTFLLRDYLMVNPNACYIIGLSVVVMEILLIFLLYYRRTRVGAIYLGCIFLTTLILTLDVPATFFFLFPGQLMLFINPDHLLNWIEEIRSRNQKLPQHMLVYDGKCEFCCDSVDALMKMDLFARVKKVNFHEVEDLSLLHNKLEKFKAMSQLHLVDVRGGLYGGFYAIRRMCLINPMMMPLLFIFYLPGAGMLGSMLYRMVAKNRYLFHFNQKCKNNACFR